MTTPLTLKLGDDGLRHGGTQLGTLLHGMAEVHTAKHAGVVHLVNSLRQGGRRQCK